MSWIVNAVLNQSTSMGLGNYRTDESWYVRSGRRDMSHTRRGEAGWGSRWNWATLWPSSQSMTGDDTAWQGSDLATGAAFFQSWSPWQRSMRGNGATKFVQGKCVDANGVAVVANVTLFLTGSDLMVSEGGTDDKGNYDLPSVYPGANHYVVAYRAGSPDIAGVSVNTLVPTNHDGS